MNASLSNETFFAPAARIPLSEIRRQATLLEGHPLLGPLLNALPVAVMILNRQRQIVFANEQFKSLFRMDRNSSFLGKRTGEALNCIHATDMPAGCGTSERCRACGTLNSILIAQSGRPATGEGRVTVLRDGKPVAVELRLRAQPFTFGEQTFSLLSALDISEDKRRQMLERTFFHDISNTATVITGFASLIDQKVRGDVDVDELKQLAGYVSEASDHLLDEIMAQRQLTAAESGELKVNLQQATSASLITATLNLYQRQPLANDRQLQMDPATENLILWTDIALLGRVIGNMVKNALEASEPGETITVGCHKIHDKVSFWVHNPQYIPRSSQLRIFKRSFSTKGENRGLGTYSMKLLSEGYLNGRVSLTSSAEAGTTFKATVPVEWDDPETTHRSI